MPNQEGSSGRRMGRVHPYGARASAIMQVISRFKRAGGSKIDWSDEQRARRPIREYLAALDGENTPTNPKREPKALWATDPSAACTSRGRHK